MKQDISIKGIKKGFTVVELIVVIVVIGILVSIIAVGYEGLQRDVRDTERAADVDTIKAALEVYYDQNGAYPSVTSGSNLHSFAIDTLNLPLTAITPPQSSSSSFIAPTTHTQEPNAGEYLYIPEDNYNTLCRSWGCTKFRILWRKEKDNSVQRVGSRYGW